MAGMGLANFALDLHDKASRPVEVRRRWALAGTGVSAPAGYPASKALTHEAGTGPVLHQPTRQVGLAPNLRARDRNQIRERRFGE